MHLLLMLFILLACIILETSDNGVKFGKVYVSRLKKNTLLFNLKPLNANVIDKCKNNQEVSPLSAELNSLPKIRINIKKKITPWFFGFNNEKYKCIKLDQLISEWHSRFYCKTSSNHRRKLLGYLNKPLYENFIKSMQSHEEEQNNLKEIGNLTDNNNELWDDWSSWSTCSVTCGSGRRVRWRHCSAEHCLKGLKRAQIKPCQLKKCDTKNVLHWLGIKTK